MADVENTKLNGVKIITPTIFKDNRGYFLESFNKKLYDNILPDISFLQDNESMSVFGTLRGIHFQKAPFGQSKLIRVIKGKIQDVAVDLRPKSLTYKKYLSIILDDKYKKQLYIPKGFAHAFLTLSDYAIVSYKVDNFYSVEHDSGIRYDDPILNIKWELEKNKISISDKDNNLPYL